MGKWENKYLLTSLKIVVLAKGLCISCLQWKQFVDQLASPVCFKNVYLNAYRVYHALFISPVVVSHIYSYLPAWPMNTFEFAIPELEHTFKTWGNGLGSCMTWELVRNAEPQVPPHTY